MPKFIYTGQVLKPIPVTTGISASNSTFPIDLSNSTVVWNEDVPNALNILSLPEIIAAYPTVIDTYMTLNAVQDISGAEMIFRTQLVFPDKYVQHKIEGIRIGQGQVQYRVNNELISPFSNLTVLPVRLTAAAYSLGGIPTPDSPARVTTMSLRFVFTTTIDCTAGGLLGDVCSGICEQNPSACFDSYKEYCFPTRIGRDTRCGDFFANYIAKVSPTASIDTEMAKFCDTNFSGFGDLFSSGTNDYLQNLCACHMPQSQYDAFTNQLKEKYPAISNLGLIDRCAVPRCASSTMKSLTTGNPCPLPQCINAIDFTNNGTFIDSTIELSNTGDCADISGGKEEEPEKPGIPAYVWILIGVAVLLLVLLIIGVIVLSLSRKQVHSLPDIPSAPVLQSST